MGASFNDSSVRFEHIAIQKDATFQQLRGHYSKIGKVAFAETGFQNRHSALHAESLPLGELAHAEIIEDDEIGPNFLREKQCAELAESETETLFGGHT